MMDRGYDSDSFKIKVDNCCSASFTNDLKDVVGEPVPIKANVKGFGGSYTPVTHRVTIKWTIEDDSGMRHTITLPNSYYAPHGERLLAPQHWAQVAKDNYPSVNGTCCLTTDKSVILYWSQRRYTRTVPLDPKSNIGIMRSAPGFQRFSAFCSEVSDYDDEVALNSHLILDDEDENPDNGYHDQGHAPVPTTTSKEEVHLIPNDEEPKLQREDSIVLDGIESLPEVEEPSNISDQGLLMRWHVRLGHLSFKRLKCLAWQGVLPKKLVKVETPICIACKYGKATRKAWRSRSEPNKIFKAALAPGDCVSVDQLVSSTPGFVAQMRGALTKARYTGCTVFVDHYSRLCYIHPQKSLSAAETLEAKHSFERLAATHGVRIKHYHADNGRFSENAWVKDLKTNQQTISFCGVDAHHQNGIAEKAIRDLQDQARTIIIHAHHRWPQAITPHLWPYALRMANSARNSVPKELDSPSPLELFSGVKVMDNLNNFHTFGCPVFAYEPATSKWAERARLGLYLGPSPNHAKSVALVLNLQTGLVSPQFHVSFDEHFTTIKDMPQGVSDKWTYLAGLMGGETAPVSPWTLSTIDVPAPSPNTNIAAPAPTSLPAEQVQQVLISPRLGEEGSSNLPAPEASVIASCQEVLNSQIEEDVQFQDDPIALIAKRDPDTLYLNEALKASDRKQFIKAMKDEVQQHEELGHWQLVKRADLPEGTKILPSVWAMKRKRRIDTREVYKWKARLNVHGGKQEYGTHYTETYSPVIGWATIRLFLILSIIFKWHTRQLDFVLAYPQADIEQELYMELPAGLDFKVNKHDYALKLLKNLYGQKQAGRVWHQHLIKGLIEMGFKQSKIDECLLYRGSLALLIYVDDTIVCSKTKQDADEFLSQLHAKFKVQEVGDIKDFLGVQVTNLSEGGILLNQPHLIDSILDELKLCPAEPRNTPRAAPKTKDVPIQTTDVPHQDLRGKPFNEPWHYRRVIGKLNFLEKSTRPDIAYAVHQAARFQIDPKESHAKAVKRIGRYLLATRDKGYIINPKDPILECYADADFSGNWRRDIAEKDKTTAQSRTGFVILFAGCPLFWGSRLQTEIALSTTEAEYIALSTALRETIPLINLLQELKDMKFIDDFQVPKVLCKAFEDNSGALELAQTPKMRPRTKHINIKYHHFRSYVDAKIITLQKVTTDMQLADIFTKPLSYSLFQKLRTTLLGW
jgi:hypothetical protein